MKTARWVCMNDDVEKSKEKRREPGRKPREGVWRIYGGNPGVAGWRPRRSSGESGRGPDACFTRKFNYTGEGEGVECLGGDFSRWIAWVKTESRGTWSTTTVESCGRRRLGTVGAKRGSDLSRRTVNYEYAGPTDARSTPLRHLPAGQKSL